MKYLSIIVLICCKLAASAQATDDQCAGDLACFIAAYEARQSSSVTFSSQQFFMPQTEPILQIWQYDASSNRFSLTTSKGAAIRAVLKKRLPFGYGAAEWTMKLEQIPADQPLTIHCDCAASDRFADQLRVWSYNSYELKDLERYHCYWAPPLVEVSVAELPEITDGNVSVNEVHVRFPVDYTFSFGDPKGTYAELAVRFSEEVPYALDVKASQISLIADELGNVLYSPELISEKRAVLHLNQALRNTRREPQGITTNNAKIRAEDSTYYVPIRTDQLPENGNQVLTFAGKLVFEYPSEETITVVDTLYYDGKRQQFITDLGLQIDVRPADEVDIQTNFRVQYYGTQPLLEATVSLPDGTYIGTAENPNTIYSFDDQLGHDFYLIKTIILEGVYKILPFRTTVSIGL